MEDTVIISGAFVRDTGVWCGQVEVINGIITRIGHQLGEPTHTFPLEMLIFPGMGDIHVHAREDMTGAHNYKEDYDTVARAAINGGVVHIAVMPNTPHPLLTIDDLEWHRARCASAQMPQVHNLHYVGIGPGTRPITSANGANVPYKVFTGPSVGSLFFSSEHELCDTLCHYAGQHVSFHVEDYEVLCRQAGAATHDLRRPEECVETALAYVLKMIEEYDIKAKLCHWSCAGRSIEMIVAHRRRGFTTTIEVSPLHLYFDTDMIDAQPELWPYLQANPSLRGRAHRLVLIDALRSGFIDYLATDHAPHTLAEKFNIFGGEAAYHMLLAADAAECRRLSCRDGVSGTPQLDTYGHIAAWLMHDHHFTAHDIHRVCCANPGAFVNQFHDGDGRFGHIDVGYYGSFTVIDPTSTTTIIRPDLKTKAGWSPFEGVVFPGRVRTIIKGMLVK
jgi:dihydroorotase